jgi:hypothetical protein
MEVNLIRLGQQEPPTMLPISVDPRAQANKMSLHPPVENSFDVVPVPPRPSWRTSIGPAAAKLARALMRIEDWKYMVGRIETNGC